VVSARRYGWDVKPGIALKSVNGFKDHLKPISKQLSARNTNPQNLNISDDIQRKTSGMNKFFTPICLSVSF
jgi:hypothetical protein